MKWIKVADKLPKEGQRVIYYFEHTGIDIGRFTQNAFKDHKMDTFYGNGGWLSDDVTHWMPLPIAPSSVMNKTTKKGVIMGEFKKELEELINKHSVENIGNIPDFLLAEMICCFIEGVCPKIKTVLDWHGCDPVCHPKSI